MGPTRRQLLLGTVTYSLLANLRTPVCLAETKIFDPLKPHASVVAFANSLKGKSLLESVKALYSEYKVNGNAKIAEKDSNGAPLTAEETFSAKHGDCSELAYLMISSFVALDLNNRTDVKIGALECHVKGKSDDEWHLVPVILVKDLPVELRFPLFEKDEKFRDRTSELAGLSENWHMLVVDPLARAVGVLSQDIEKARYAPFKGANAFYFREYGVFELRRSNFGAAQKQFEKAVESYDDYLSHTNLSVLFSRQGKYKAALEHAKKGYQGYSEDDTTKNNYGVALYNWAIYLSENGKPKEALEFLRKAAEFGNKEAKEALK